MMDAQPLAEVAARTMYVNDRASRALGIKIQFVGPGQAEGIGLEIYCTATAEELTPGGSTGIYDVVVHNQEGREIALFRGNSHRIKGSIVTEGENTWWKTPVSTMLSDVYWPLR